MGNFKAPNRLSPSEARNMDRLFDLISESNDPLLSDLADDISIRKTFGGFDSKESEQSQYSDAQKEYEKQRIEKRNVNSGNNRRVATAVNTSLSDKNAAASASKTLDGFAGTLRTNSSCYDSFQAGVRQHRRSVAMGRG